MKDEMTKGFVVDVYKQRNARVVEFIDNLDNLYELTDCSCIDVAYRKVGKYFYDIVCDDEGLYRADRIPSAFNHKGEPMLVGNLLFLNHDEEGEFTSLTDEQIADLSKHIGEIYCEKDDEGFVCNIIVGCEYE